MPVPAPARLFAMRHRLQPRLQPHLLTSFGANRIGIALLMSALCWTQTGHSSDSNDTQVNTIEGIELEILSTNERLKELDAQIIASRALRDKLTKALNASNEKVGEREKRIKGLTSDIDAYNQRLDKLDADIELAENNVEQRKQLLAESIRRAQRVASGSGLKVILQNDNPAAADRLGVYTGYFMRAQQQAIIKQQASLKIVTTAKQEALKNRNWLNHIKKKATKQFDSYQTQSSQNQQSIGKVELEITDKTRTVAQLRHDQERLQALMEELRAAQVSRSGYFLAGQGSYALPVAGEIKAHFGDIKSVGKLRWNGYFIDANNGTPVRTVADGEVVYSDWLQGFGMLVIVDHGDGYMTLYGGNRDVAVKKDDWVETGATIATVGDSGGQKTSGVYFEIRHNAKPVDPKEWVSAKNSFVSAKK